MESTPPEASPSNAPELTPSVTHDAASGATSYVALPVEGPRPIPYWHTALLLLVFGALSVANVKSGYGAHAGHGHISIYLGTIIYEWLFTGYVWWGVRRAGGSLRELIGGRWNRVEDFLIDIAIGAGAWIGALLVIAMAAVAMGMDHSGNIDEARKQLGFLAPQSSLEIILWICLSATAGFCEEVLFRGYLQKQFTRLLRNRWVALAVVSILFGLGHGYEGSQRMVLIALLGLSFGILSMWRKSLRPAMMAHTMQDTVSGLLLRALR
jgi:membrane protease YdiL (CAAX protease family)